MISTGLAVQNVNLQITIDEYIELIKNILVFENTMGVCALFPSSPMGLPTTYTDTHIL